MTKNKLSLKGNIAERVEEILVNDEVVDVLNEPIFTLSYVLKNDIKGDGFVRLPNESAGLLRISDKWYSIKTDVDIENILITLLGEQLYQLIQTTYYEYLDLISVLETKEESLKYSKPIFIYVKKE